MQIEIKCKDYGRDGCLEIPDEAYTMNFDDIGEEPIRFCAFCGPENFKLKTALEDALRTRGPEFVAKLTDAVMEAEREALKSKA